MNHFINCVTKNYAKFEGRASRQEYWMYYLFYTIILLFIMIIEYVRFDGDMVAVDKSYLILLWYFGNQVPSLAVSIRRLHDTNNSGHQLWWILTVVGVFWLLFLFVKRGDLGQNKYGGCMPSATLSYSKYP